MENLRAGQEIRLSEAMLDLLMLQLLPLENTEMDGELEG